MATFDGRDKRIKDERAAAREREARQESGQKARGTYREPEPARAQNPKPISSSKSISKADTKEMYKNAGLAGEFSFESFWNWLTSKSASEPEPMDPNELNEKIAESRDYDEKFGIWNDIDRTEAVRKRHTENPTPQDGKSGQQRIDEHDFSVSKGRMPRSAPTGQLAGPRRRAHKNHDFDFNVKFMLDEIEAKHLYDQTDRARRINEERE